MDRGPAVAALLDVGGRAGRAIGRDDHRDEAVVALPMHGRGEAHADRTHPALGERERCPLVEDAPARPGGWLGHVALGGQRAGPQAGNPRGDRQRPIRPGQRLAERLDRGQIRADGCLEVAGEGDVVSEREVHDPVTFVRGRSQHVEIADVAAAHLRASGSDRLGGRVGAREAEDLVFGCQQLGHDSGADPAGRAGDKYAHGVTSSRGRGRGDTNANCRREALDALNVSYCRQPSRRMTGSAIAGTIRA